MSQGDERGPVRVDATNGVLTATLDDPGSRNALSPALVQAFAPERSSRSLREQRLRALKQELKVFVR